MSGSSIVPRERERVGNYLLGSEIGRGSFATVLRGYKAVSFQSSRSPFRSARLCFLSLSVERGCRLGARVPSGISIGQCAAPHPIPPTHFITFPPRNEKATFPNFYLYRLHHLNLKVTDPLTAFPLSLSLVCLECLSLGPLDYPRNDRD